MAYSKTNWQDLPSTTTPLNATNLNKIENKLQDLDSNKLSTSGGTVTGEINVTGKMTVGDSTHNAGIEIYHNTPFIDFHFGRSSEDYTSRIIEEESGVLNSKGNFQIMGYNIPKIFAREPIDTTTKNYTLTHQHCYLIITGHSISDSASMHFVFAHNSYGRVNTVMQNSNVTVTINNLSLTVTTTNASNITIIDCG